MSQFLNDSVLVKIRKVLMSHPEIVAGYIFGSRFKGNFTEKSDLDVALICLDNKSMSPLDLAGNLKRFFPTSELDINLLDLKSDPFLLIRVINGKVIYQKTLPDRTNLETRILHLCEDYRNLRKISQHYLNKSFKEGVYASG